MNIYLYGMNSEIGKAVSIRFARNHRVTVLARDGLDGLMVGREDSIDLVVVSVGWTPDGKLTDLSDDDWTAAVDANLSSVFRALRRLLPKVVDGGSVVVLGSIVGTTGGYGCGAYAAAKAGLVGLVRAAANENAARGVCINLLELGYVDAGMGARLNPRVKEKVLPTIPLKRFARLDEVVDAVDFLARCKYMTGNVLTVAGGLR